MSQAATPERSENGETTRDRLVLAAGEAFNTDGFAGTNTNKIARLAGFAPQTFYRHFEDKIGVFLAVYEKWRRDENVAVARALESNAPNAAVGQAVLAHHVAWAEFRRSLRTLAVVDPRVRAARAASRAAQIDTLAAADTAGRSRAEFVGALLRVERLCDAAADGELADLGLNQTEVLALIEQAVAAARGEVGDGVVARGGTHRKGKAS